MDFEFWRIANHVEASFQNLEANRNGANGFLVEDGQSHTANLLIDPSEAGNNDAHGFRALLNTESDTSITVLDATANGNVSEGVHVTINNNTGTGRILLNRITANGSPDDDGVDVEVHSGGDVDVDLLNITAGNNDGVGVEIGLTAGGAQIVKRNIAQIPVEGDIDLTLDRITAAMNGEEGIDLNLAAGGNVFITGRRNSVHDNSLDGVRVNATAFGTVDADFGEFDLLAFANLFNLGLNSFFNNGSLDMNNVNSGDYTVNAEGNFWGTTTPTIGEEISDGINATIPLPINVNP